jgi:hypothetical protein
MRIYIYFFFIVSFFSFLSCGDQPPFSGKIEIDPESDWVSRVYLIQPRDFDGITSSYEGVVLDSAIIDTKGNFLFKAMPNAPEPILLQIAIQKEGERFLNKLENDEL